MSMLPEPLTREHADPGRRAAFRALLHAARLADVGPQALFEGFADALPFHLGESRAEATVPYAVSDDLDGLCAAAVADLLELFRSRHEPRGDARDARAQLLTGEAEAAAARRAPPPSYLVPKLSDAAARNAVAGVAGLDPHLDPALLEAWLRAAPARGFQEELGRLFGAAVEEDIRGQGRTRFAFLAALAVVQRCEAHKSKAKALTLRQLSYERLERAVGLSLFALADAAAGAAIAGRTARRLPFDLTLATGLCRAALGPLVFISIRSRALGSDLNPWGLGAELAAAVEPCWAELLSDDPDPTTIELRLQAGLLARRQLVPGLVAGARCSLLRARGLELLARLDGQAPDLCPELEKAIRSDAELERFAADPRGLAARVSRTLRLPRTEPLDALALERLLEAARLPGVELAAAEVARNFVGYALDRFAADQVDGARARLRDRRAEMPAAELYRDYEKGKLYRLAGDGKPLLKPLQRRAEGHLFVDLKGYTQRTHRAKELVMAEFLREEFYKPILGAAASLLGMSGGGRDRLRLQNLLGDAAAFSGDVALLVALARQIQRICAEYGEKLAARTTGLRPEEILDRRNAALGQAEAEIDRFSLERSLLASEVQRKRALSSDAAELHLHELYARRVADLSRRRNEALGRARADADPGQSAAARDEVRRCDGAILALDQRGKAIFEGLEQLSDGARAAAARDLVTATEVQRIAELDQASSARRRALEVQLQGFEEELRAARGYGLDAGLFIAFGAEAEEIRVLDDAFGEVKVAVAEKINEAARGTARNAQLKAKLDAHLARARSGGADARLSVPFRVHVDTAYGLVVPPELEELLAAAVRTQEPARVAELGRALAEGIARDLHRGHEPKAEGGSGRELLTVANEIYNVGEALSAEALDAFIRETLSSRYHLGHTVRVDALHASIRERFLILEETLQLVISVPHGDDLAEALVFRLAGHVHFRGFEAKGATAVYELVRPGGEFLELLREFHLAAWTEQAREDPARLLTSLLRT